MPQNYLFFSFFLIFSQVFARFEHFSHQNLSLSPRFEFRTSCFVLQLNNSSQLAYIAQLTHKITLNMQNKPNLRRHKMYVTLYGHKDYKKMRVREPRKNKPNFNPSKIGVYPDSSAACRQWSTHHPRTVQPTIKMQNKPNFRKAKMNVTFYAQRDYENLRLPGQQKNKPNQTQFQTRRFDPPTSHHTTPDSTF